MTISQPQIFIPLHGLLKVTRFGNLLIIAVTQWSVFSFLIFKGIYVSVDLLLLITSTVFIAAAGYIINDYYDVKIDLINKPTRVVIGSAINRRWAMIIHAVFSSVGVIIGFYLNLVLGIVDLFTVALLWTYSLYFKRTALWGNIIISFLTSLSILVVWLLYPVQNMAVPVLAMFAFLITLIREIIKDMEDVRGDHAFGCTTLPILWGIRKTRWLVQGVIILMITLLILLSLNTQELYIILFSGVVVLQLAYLFFDLRRTDTVSGFRKTGKLCKLIMLTGLLGVFFL